MSKKMRLTWRFSCYEAFIADPERPATLGLDIKLLWRVRVIYCSAVATAASGFSGPGRRGYSRGVGDQKRMALTAVESSLAG